MADLSETGCLERMCDLMGAHEDWLVERVMSYAHTHGFDGRSPRSEAAWRDAVRGLSDALFQAVYSAREGGTDEPPRLDPVAAYGVVRARTHRPRGVTPALWLGLLHWYRRAYLDLLGEGGFEPEEEQLCSRFIDRVFDRFEAGFCNEWESDRGSGPRLRGALAD